MTGFLVAWNICLLLGIPLMSFRHYRAEQAWEREQARLRRELEDVKQAAWQNFEEADRLAERLADTAPAVYREPRTRH